MKRKYVCGFLFSPDYEQVVLIRKKRPEWQNGLLNGVGGKINEFELPHDAMIREFKEETGLIILDWIQFTTLEGPDYIVYFFKANSYKWDGCKTMTDEPIEFIDVHNLLGYNIVSNLCWLIPMSLDNNHLYGDITTK